MTIFVLGSVNIDTVCRVHELPRPGETVSGTCDPAGLGGKGANQAVALARAAEFLCQLARRHRGELVVCAIGPITNVALALRLDPEFASNVARIVFMGGAWGVPGNVTPHAEANTWNDAEALNIVINSGADVVMVGLDVTNRTLCDPAFFGRLAKANPKLGGFLQDASHFYLDFYHRKLGQRACSLHDPAAVIACTHPDLFEMARLQVAVNDSGDEIGRTILSPDSTAGTISVCLGGDMERVKAQFAQAFNAR